VARVDPELAGWLARGPPTLYVNLGSLCRLEEGRAVEMAGALKLVLERAGREGKGGGGGGGSGSASGLQVLWKLKKHGEYETGEAGCRIHGVLGEEMERGVVRIVDWLVPEPIAVLESGNVVCAVHHGGANSFNEAVVYVHDSPFHGHLLP
jgi:hypothetical protein